MLIVIDVQKKYPASQIVVTSVLKEIRRACSHNEPIIIVNSGGRALSSIYKALKGYKYLRITKSSDDGEPSIFFALTQVSNNLSDRNLCNINSVKTIKVCGVNTSACVMATVRSLSYLRFSVKVLSHACANKYVKFSNKKNLSRHNWALKTMSTWKNVEII